MGGPGRDRHGLLDGAAGLAGGLGGTPAQVGNATELGIAHSIRISCGPVSGLVAFPCIPPNTVTRILAITPTPLALRGDGVKRGTLARGIRTIRRTGTAMKIRWQGQREAAWPST